MPKCGNCSKDHPTVQDVKNCYGGIGPMESVKYTIDNEEAEAAKTLDRMAGLESRTGAPLWPASDKQKTYVLGLQDERRLPDDWTIRSMEDLDKMERDEVSSLITMLKSFPKGDSKPSRYSMPPGKYAVAMPVPGSSVQWNFYEVQHGKDRWEGYTFIKQLFGSPGKYRKEDMSPNMRSAVLAIIDGNPKKASLDYGLQSGSCGICSSPLTNPESLKAGIGPVCRNKVGW